MIMCILTYSLLITLVTWQTGVVQAYNHTDRLFRDFISPYNHRIRPVIRDLDAMDVAMTFGLLNLHAIDEVEKMLEVAAFINFSWTDQLRGWEPDSYGGVRYIHPDPLDIWRPRVVLSNAVHTRDIFGDEYTILTLNHNGMTSWIPGADFGVTCELDLTYYPFDQQTCFINLLINEFREEVKVTQARFFSGSYVSNGEWHLLGSSIQYLDIPGGPGQTLTFVQIYLSFARRPAFFIYNVIFPVCLISFTSSLVFVLPEKRGDRACFSITVLLSLSIFMGLVSEELPKNSDKLPVIIKFMFSLIVHNALCVTANVWHLRWLWSQTVDRSGHKRSSIGHPSHLGKQLGVATGMSHTQTAPNGPDEGQVQNPTCSYDNAFYGPDRFDFRRDPPSQIGHSGQDDPGTISHKLTSNGLPIQPLITPGQDKIVRVVGLTTRTTASLCGTLTRAVVSWAQDTNVQLFLLFTATWAVISVYYICWLLQYI